MIEFVGPNELFEEPSFKQDYISFCRLTDSVSFSVGKDGKEVTVNLNGRDLALLEKYVQQARRKRHFWTATFLGLGYESDI